MVLQGPRQPVKTVFEIARGSLTVQGRVDRRSFFEAICEGVKAGLFGYAEAADASVVRGGDAELTPEVVRFSGLLIGKEVPLPVTADEVMKLVPAEGRMPVQELYQVAVATYGAERVSEQSLLNALSRCLAEGRFGYAATETATVQPGPQAVSIDGYVGQPEALPPDTRVVRFSGAVSSLELANVMKAAINLSKLGESDITLDLCLELKGALRDVPPSLYGLVGDLLLRLEAARETCAIRLPSPLMRAGQTTLWRGLCMSRDAAQQHIPTSMQVNSTVRRLTNGLSVSSHAQARG